ncbi:MAG: 2,3-bisphosphoglycerate-independent phosphoglycerate mutase [Desulfovibrionaceae bacterium]|nr:2,3-bisphosphoglycerate-independent phosphoglycerate mutase [Desulfovibrionaceae bacterium]
MTTLTPTLLLILDGYGLAPAGPGNAASLARTPNLDRLLALPGVTSLAASGRAVGLPEGFIGNSEVGHLNIGAGRVVYQDLTRIDMAVESNELFRNDVLLDLCAAVRERGGRLHFAGLLSDGGVHSHINHLIALLMLAREQNVPALVHAFMDGRDTAPTDGVRYVEQLQQALNVSGARLATVCGRFYAMDRDKRWERVEQAWNLLIHGRGERMPDPVAALRDAYAAGESDEFIKPGLCLDAAEAAIRSGDGIFFFNFRADRARELVAAFINDAFDGFERGARPDLAGVATMTSYDASFTVPVAFRKENVTQTLGEVVADMGLRQLRIAETEKYAHVTYFFNGGREEPFPGEDRVLVQSPRDVPTYDLKPEMSVFEVTDKLIQAWNSGQYGFAVCNLANPDMVGHTGVLKAAIAACEAVDACVGRIESAVLAVGGRLCVSADHGNVESMIGPDNAPQTAHTTNRTPLIITQGDGRSVQLAGGGKLADIAPTLLALWGKTPPGSMSGDILARASA